MNTEEHVISGQDEAMEKLRRRIMLQLYEDEKQEKEESNRGDEEEIKVEEEEGKGKEQRGALYGEWGQRRKMRRKRGRDGNTVQTGAKKKRQGKERKRKKDKRSEGKKKGKEMINE